MKWLLTTTKSNHGFRLSMTTLLSKAAAELASDTTTQANPNSTWDLPTPEAFLGLARPHLIKIGKVQTDSTRHALISHDAVIEQWLHVGLFLYPINTIAQQLWTVAYSYVQRVLANHPGQHQYSEHPTADLDHTDEDYLETHPFTSKFRNSLHPIPVTHSCTYIDPLRHATKTQAMRFAGTTMSTLYKRFRNLMRLRGILHSIIFIVRAKSLFRLEGQKS